MWRCQFSESSSAFPGGQCTLRAQKGWAVTILVPEAVLGQGKGPTWHPASSTFQTEHPFVPGFLNWELGLSPHSALCHQLPGPAHFSS